MNAQATRMQHDAGRMLAALDRLQGSGAEFGGFLANHGPMAADALIRLGGGDRVDEWVEQYRCVLEPAPEHGDAVTSENWRRELGRIDRLGDWNSYFRIVLTSQPWRDVLATWWPRLLPGAAASATHGLIRTAHAVRNLVDGDDTEPLLIDELGAGLAYWAARHLPLPGSPALTGGAGLGDAIAGLPRLDPGVPSAAPGLDGRLRLLFGLDELPAALDAWGPGVDDAAALDQLIGMAATVLARRSDSQIAFCHAVTAPSAVRMILPSIPAQHVPATVAVCWQVVASIVAAFAWPRDADDTAVVDAPSVSPDDLADAAVAHGDEHVVKLTEACLRQFDLTGDATMLVAAERYRARMEPFWHD